MVLVRCAIVGGNRVVAVSMKDDGEFGIPSLRYEFIRQSGLPVFGTPFIEVYQARQFGIPGGPFLTTTHPDYEELARGNEDVMAMHLTEAMRMSQFRSFTDYIDVDSAPDAIHVLMKMPTLAEIEAINRRGRKKKAEALHQSESVWTSLSRAVSSWFDTTTTHEKKGE